MHPPPTCLTPSPWPAVIGQSRFLWFSAFPRPLKPQKSRNRWVTPFRRLSSCPHSRFSHTYAIRATAIIVHRPTAGRHSAGCCHHRFTISGAGRRYAESPGNIRGRRAATGKPVIAARRPTFISESCLATRLGRCQCRSGPCRILAAFAPEPGIWPSGLIPHHFMDSLPRSTTRSTSLRNSDATSTMAANPTHSSQAPPLSGVVPNAVLRNGR